MTIKQLKPRKCRVCPETFWPRNSLHVVCSLRCASQNLKNENEKKFNQETKRRKAALKTHGQWTKEVQIEFNRFIRLRDSELPCISCGDSPAIVHAEQSWKVGGAWDCGHFLSVGAFPELRFNEINAHRQCKACNSGSHNHIKKGRSVAADYRANLIHKIGLPLVEWLESPHKPMKATIEELKFLKKYYKEQTKLIQELRA